MSQSSPFARKSRRLNSEMNVVPYIDVMLVLLVIFMITAPMLTTGVEVDLPKEQAKSVAQNDKLPIIITLNKNGELYLSSERAIDEPITESALLTRLSELNSDGNLQVMINADATNSYKTIMHLMAALQRGGIAKVGLLTDAPPK